MLNHHKCKLAREYTGCIDPDSEIIDQYNELSESEKELIINELQIIMGDNDECPSHNDWREICKKRHWITHPVLVCVYMEWKSKSHQ